MARPGKTPSRRAGRDPRAFSASHKITRQRPARRNCRLATATTRVATRPTKTVPPRVIHDLLIRPVTAPV